MNTNEKKLEKIIVVGSGTAGLISALILHSTYNCKIQIVASKSIGVLRVGEGSTEHFSGFLNYVGIPHERLLREAGATYKQGIYFKDWDESDYFHSLDEYNFVKFGNHNYYGMDCIVKNIRQINSNHNVDFKSNSVIRGHNIYQYHFDAVKLNKFLLTECRDRGMSIINDTISKVIVNGDGIEELQGNAANYRGDFYIDCTGFRRTLISELGSNWKSLSKYLKMNQAIGFTTKMEDDFPAYTLSQKMRGGWMWRIPLQDRWGNGFVFDNQSISAEEAKRQCEEVIGNSIDIETNIKFDPGYLERPLIKNCMAVGLAANFVEPLEASSIGTIIQQMFLACNCIDFLPNKEIEDSFNNDMKSIIYNIRDFILLHYNYSGNLPESLRDKLDLWSKRPPISIDFDSDSRYCLFKEDNFFQILWGREFFDRERVREIYDRFPSHITKRLNAKIERLINEPTSWTSHKQLIQESLYGQI